MSAERRLLVLAACECARLALPYVPADEERPRAAIELAERWARGDDSVTREQMFAAAAAAATAAETSPSFAAAYAAAATAYAAADRRYSIAVTSTATSTATAIAAAVAGNEYNVAFAGALARCADIVRRHYPNPPEIRP